MECLKRKLPLNDVGNLSGQNSLFRGVSKYHLHLLFFCNRLILSTNKVVICILKIFVSVERTEKIVTMQVFPGKLLLVFALFSKFDSCFGLFDTAE
jgi:hypothetical protein